MGTGSFSLSPTVSVPLDHKIVVGALEEIGAEVDPVTVFENINPPDCSPGTKLVVAIDVSMCSMYVACRGGVTWSMNVA